jgi:hypothetical protein
MSTSPDQQLKDKIIGEIERKKLLSEENLKRLAKQYLTKPISSEEWGIIIDKEIHIERGGDEDL